MLTRFIAAYRADLKMARRTRRYPRESRMWRRAAASWALLAAQELAAIGRQQPIPQPAYVKQARYYRTRARTLSR